MRARAKNAAATWICAAIVAGAAGRAFAGDLPTYDLASLCFEASAVVLADAITPPGAPHGWDETLRYRVRKVYMGSLAPGTEIEVSIAEYALDGGVATPRLTGRGPGAVLFLGAPRRESGRTVYDLVPSGLRVLAHGGVYRFDQFDNPGPYEPVPQGPDPLEAEGLAADAGAAWTTPLSLADFEAALRVAQARAGAVHGALALPPSRARTEALLALLPPPRTFPRPVPYRPFTRFVDGLDLAIQEAIVASGDAVATEDALGRDVQRYDDFFVPGLGDGSTREIAGRAAALMAAARSRGRPVAQRVACIRALGTQLYDLDDGSGPEPKASSVRAALAPLLGDPDPSVRRAVVDALAWMGGSSDGEGRSPDRAPTITLLRARARHELDPGVLIALARGLAKLDASSPTAPLTRRVIAVALPGPPRGARRDHVDVGYSYIAPPSLAEATLVVSGRLGPAAGGASIPCTGSVLWSSSDGNGLVRLTPTAPVSAGRYALLLTLELRGRRGAHAAVATTPIEVTISE